MRLPSAPTPQNALDVRRIVEERLAALQERPGTKETVTIEWRDHQLSIPVISLPIELLTYNPGTHRIRAQRSLEPERDRLLDSQPFGTIAQAYLHQLIKGDPADPTKVDTSFIALTDDLRQYGQSDPGISTRDGVLVNGNTRLAALQVLGQENMRVGILPPDAGLNDIRSIELSLQLRKDQKRDYSFMNFLLSLEEQVDAGRPAAEIQKEFRIKAPTFERSRWILAFILQAIQRSEVEVAGGKFVSMRLVDFETDQGKLEELHRAYTALKIKSPDEAEALREQRLFAIALNKSKTDVRLIEPDFFANHMKLTLTASEEPATPGRAIPGTSIRAAAPSEHLVALRNLTTKVLKARAVAMAPDSAAPEDIVAAGATLRELDDVLDAGLTQAGQTGRIVKKRLAAAIRLSDANEDLRLCLTAVAESRAANNFDPADLDDGLGDLKGILIKLAQLVSRGIESGAEGVEWLRLVAGIPDQDA